jgi:hypothetical protein
MDLSKAPSPEMEDAVCRAGSIHILCELCGRTHFASATPGYFDEGELEDLLTKKQAEPDKCLEDSGADSILYGHIDGKQAVLGCPCNGLSKYEDFIWRNRDVILSYLERRTKARLQKATQEAELVARVKERLP